MQRSPMRSRRACSPPSRSAFSCLRELFLPSLSQSWMASRLRFFIMSTHGLVGLLTLCPTRGTSIVESVPDDIPLVRVTAVPQDRDVKLLCFSHGFPRCGADDGHATPRQRSVTASPSTADLSSSTVKGRVRWPSVSLLHFTVSLHLRIDV